MFTLSRLLIACLLLTGTSQALAEETLRVAADLAYPPFQFRDNNGQPGGFEIDITRAVCKAINVKCEFVVSSFDAEIPSLLARKVDFISPLGATEKRRQSIDFSNFIFHIPTKLVARKDSGLLPTVASLRGKQIAVQQGSIQEMYANQYWAPQGINVMHYADADAIYQDLAAGRLDGALSPGVAVTFGFLNKPEGKDFALVGPEVRDDKLFSLGSAYGVRKGNSVLLKRLNDGLTKIMADGTWQKIKQHYFGDLEMKVAPQDPAHATH
ncbi:ABC transporter substrate-binding protein [Erwinia sp. OLTSP20]|uniref:transporter substrate-binding domain-containing protein n=1 Tax=unclassified Erwinia TaxID=2622719 RepID=UPI000C18B42A|nr:MULTISPECIES: transporter substrate-binding domain-containing protein [unclassified Erwinia]PIJ48442.1 ABC transporter substrate-binding protein [Erwinia sp. OAMSP11]PIJ65973.1 ABC transporter substrate-binding protein [Erwinia sp. OLSSP12]PIJ78598.1 ABC transporter substrate-binding protein [Erwinia sp. OLCASP19]PIJ79072.1 ABC transporter substrate-binding protein [Erwinia sp. OLMTSP26]PIJ80965.1 ABC transporter substrate-binding protein [Erwinia sp. OLMDSP33]